MTSSSPTSTSPTPSRDAADAPASTLPTSYRPWLHRLSVFYVLATFALIAVGGSVTSHGAGLAVPDWPETFGYNMFFTPLEVWVGQPDIFLEHFHRLKGSFVGLLTLILAGWIWATQGRRPWLVWLSVAAVGLVIVQGVMGGLRVTEISTAWAIAHGVVGQVFLGMTVVIAAATSRWWLETDFAAASASRPAARLLWPAAALVAVLVVQLVLGAWMRHTGSGLAIPDFPLAYGQVVPPMSGQAIAQTQQDWARLHPEQSAGIFSTRQVHLHFGHRIGAILVTAATLWLLWAAGRRPTGLPRIDRLPWLIAFGMLLQILLGASVIWTQRQPDMATVHQSLGAILLAAAVLLVARLQRAAASPAGADVTADQPSHATAVDRPTSAVTPTPAGAA